MTILSFKNNRKDCICYGDNLINLCLHEAYDRFHSRFVIMICVYICQGGLSSKFIRLYHDFV